jgi:hypothetical protein
MIRTGIFNANFYDTLYYERLPVYTTAVNTRHERGTSWTVGVAFSELCGAVMDIQVIMLGATMFVETCEYISKFLKSYRITV